LDRRTHDADESWKLVLFVRHLPELTAKEEELMTEINELDSGAGHQGGHR